MCCCLGGHASAPKHIAPGDGLCVGVVAVTVDAVAVLALQLQPNLGPVVVSWWLPSQLPAESLQAISQRRGSMGEAL